jgi:hypothetical protein
MAAIGAVNNNPRTHIRKPTHCTCPNFPVRGERHTPSPSSRLDLPKWVFSCSLPCVSGRHPLPRSRALHHRPRRARRPQGEGVYLPSPTGILGNALVCEYELWDKGDLWEQGDELGNEGTHSSILGHSLIGCRSHGRNIHTCCMFCMFPPSGVWR